MPDYDIQVILNNDNQLPRDRYVNTLYYDIGDSTTFESVANAIHSAYLTHLSSYMGSQIGGMTIKFYSPGRNVLGPQYTKNFTFDPQGTPGPAEVAVCVSYYAGSNQPRNRGRVFLGPFNSSTVGSERPAAIQNAALAWATAIKNIGNLTTDNWRQHSRVGAGSYKDVTNFYVDNAWDTQRRRGAKPTSRVSGTA